MRAVTTDDVYIAAAPADVHRALLQAGTGARWWPGARVRSKDAAVEVRAPASRVRPRVRFCATVGTVRPGEGFVWHVDGREVRGTAEWWLEPFKDGTIVHHVLDLERAGLRRLSTASKRHRWAMRRAMLGLKDALETR